MVRTSKTVTISLPPDLRVLLDDLCRDEGRTTSELMREALRRYAEEREWTALFRYGRVSARNAGVQPEDVEDIVDAIRK
ncbi:MAG: CopG family transcriptional regulator [Dehalococcoidia bacterium]|nr:CopG family transcriptional regulator [Dehalococcoidia bacterium]